MVIPNLFTEDILSKDAPRGLEGDVDGGVNGVVAPLCNNKPRISLSVARPSAVSPYFVSALGSTSLVSNSLQIL